jgi:hypothetical protein
VIKRSAALSVLALLLNGCDKSGDGDDAAAFDSRYKALAGETTLLTVAID